MKKHMFITRSTGKCHIGTKSIKGKSFKKDGRKTVWQLDKHSICFQISLSSIAEEI